MSETMSSRGNWAQFYQHNLSSQTPPVGEQESDVTAATTTATVTSINSPHALATTGSTTAHLNPDGRVSKPIRRRSRASRRTPTTLLNTDTSNFRAMVQQFTGGPSAPFASHPAAPNFGFGLGMSRHHPSPVMVPPGFHLQFQQQQQQQQQQHQYMFPVNNNNSNNNTSSNSDLFLQRLTASNSSRGTNMNMGVVSDELGVEGFAASSISRPSSNENRGTNYMF